MWDEARANYVEALRLQPHNPNLLQGLKSFEANHEKSLLKAAKQQVPQRATNRMTWL